MPLYTTTFDLPAQVRDAVAADVDADGVMELIVSSTKDAGELPEKLTLTIYNIDRAGKNRSRRPSPSPSAKVWGGVRLVKPSTAPPWSSPALTAPRAADATQPMEAPS